MTAFLFPNGFWYVQFVNDQQEFAVQVYFSLGIL